MSQSGGVLAVGQTKSSFYGRTLNKGESSGFRLTETVYSTNFQTRSHSHEYAYLSITLNGVSKQYCAGLTRECEAGTLIFHPPREVHRDHFLAPSVRVLQIEVLPSRLEQFLERVAGSMQTRFCRTGAYLGIATRLIDELHAPDDVSALCVEGLTLELFTEVWRGARLSSAPRAPLWLKRARDLIQDRFCEELTLGEIAAAVGVHASHLAREFRRHYSASIGDTVRRCRIEYACREMRDSTRPFAEIATSAGFYDQAHFCRVFRRFTGVTPRQFRETVFSC